MPKEKDGVVGLCVSSCGPIEDGMICCSALLHFFGLSVHGIASRYDLTGKENSGGVGAAGEKGGMYFGPGESIPIRSVISSFETKSRGEDGPIFALPNPYEGAERYLPLSCLPQDEARGDSRADRALDGRGGVLAIVHSRRDCAFVQPERAPHTERAVRVGARTAVRLRGLLNFKCFETAPLVGVLALKR